MKHLIFSAILFFSLIGAPKAQVLQVSFDEPSLTQNAFDSVNQSFFFITNHFNRPERIDGVKGNALRLDGWSTWIQKSNYNIPNITNQMTIEVWYATEAFSAANAGIVSDIGGGTGFSFEIDKYGQVIWAFHADGNFYFLQSNDPIEKYAWNHIVVTADLVNQTAAIYINGEVQDTENLAVHSSLNPATEPFNIGRQTNFIDFAGFNLAAANGAMDELFIYNTILSENEIDARYQEGTGIVPDLSIDPDVRHAGDHLRPQYHPMPNTAWTNEAYGLTFHNGKYHLFFQKNPNGPYLNFMHWGHLSSPDLVNWTEEKIALAPSPGFDAVGTWAGATIKDDTDTPIAFYTGVNGAFAGIGAANSLDNDLIGWEEFAQNPLIPAAPSIPLNLDFRDPFLWKSGNTYYMIIGSGIQFDGGGICFYHKSTDLVNWTELPFFYRDTDTNRSGFFWEIPFFFPVNNDDYIFGFTHTPTPGDRAETLYLTGSWVNEEFEPYDENPKQLELINENLLAPAFGEDEQGRRTYIGIIPEDRDVANQIAAGWRQTFSIPRVVTYVGNNTLATVPHPNLCRLRNVHTQVTDRTITPGSSFNIPEVTGRQTELKFDIQAAANSEFQIDVYKHSDELEVTSIVFEMQNGKIALDRLSSSLSNTLEDYREADYTFAANDTLSVHIFLDHSILEVFVDKAVVFSSRVYAREDANKIDLIVEQGSVTINQLDAWSLFGLGESSSMDVCDPTITSIEDPIQQTNAFSVFPNPTSNGLNLQFLGGHFPSGANFELFAVDGKALLLEKITTQNQWINLEDFPSGFYMGFVRYDDQIEAFKIIVE